MSTDGEYTPDYDYAHDHSGDAVETDLDDDNARPASRKRNTERAAVRRIAAKYGELATASPEHLELLSRTLGVPNTTVDLTVAVVSGSKLDLAALTDTLLLSEPSDPYESIITAISLGRARIKGVWSVLSEMGATTGPIPAGDVKAGGAIAKAAGNLNQENVDEITAVLALAKK